MSAHYTSAARERAAPSAASTPPSRACRNLVIRRHQTRPFRGGARDTMQSRTSWLVAAAGLAAALALSGAPAAAQSQSTGGTIEGTVSDPQGGVLPGVGVTVRNVATGVVRSVQTDSHGLYRAPLLPVGDYEVTATLSGFAGLRRPGLTLTLGQTLVADLTLSLATAQEEVTVTAEAPLI